MAGYVRQDVSNNIANGSVVDADDLDNEFDALAGAFNTSTGHTHDGSTAEGAPITVVGPAQDVVVDSSSMAPKTDSAYELGATTLRWSTGYIDDLVLTNALPIAQGGTGATSDSAARTALGVAIGSDVQAWSSVLDGTTASYTTAEETKLAGIEALADVTDTANVTAAGALMDSEVDADIKTLSLPANTTISTYGATLVDDANAATARTTLGLGSIATQNSGTVSITGGSITGITDLAVADGGTGASTAAGALTNLGLTATAAELNHTDGVTSNIQTQLDGKEPVDAEILRADTDDNLTAGYTSTADNDGTKSSGTYTPSPAGGNLKRIVNGGAFTLAAPTATGDYTMVIQMTNNASAGAITTSGFTFETGNVFTDTDGDDFFLHITKINGFTQLHVQALQVA